MTARQIASAWPIHEVPLDCNPDRIIRRAASASSGQVISGQRGYKLTFAATIEEVQRASNWLRHQSGEMLDRALQIDRVYHGKLRPQMPS